MTYENAIAELVELSLHEEALYEMVLDTEYSDKWASARYGVSSWHEIGYMQADALWAFMDRAKELWHELGGYELDYTEFEMRLEVASRIKDLHDEFERRPTVYHFTEFGNNLGDVDLPSWYPGNGIYAEPTAAEAYIDELEARFDAA